MDGGAGMVAVWFHRDGSPCSKAVVVDKPGVSAHYRFQGLCRRCGGQGVAEAWRYTGYTCFDCAGNGKGKIEEVKVYGAEKLAKLQAVKAKADARKAAKAKAAADTEAARIAAASEAFNAQHAALFERAAKFPNSTFVQDVVARAKAQAWISEAQIAAIVKAMDKDEADASRKAAARHVGKIGERITVKGKVKFMSSSQGQFGTSYFNIIIGDDGNCYVYSGSVCMGNSGDEVEFVASVKAHDSYQGEPQTIVARPKFKEVV